MRSFPVIIHLDILKDFTLCLVSRFKPVPVNFFNFQRVYETLSDRVIPAVSFAAHARGDLMPSKQRLIITAGILAAPVRVMNQALAEDSVAPKPALRHSESSRP